MKGYFYFMLDMALTKVLIFILKCYLNSSIEFFIFFIFLYRNHFLRSNQFLMDKLQFSAVFLRNAPHY